MFENFSFFLSQKNMAYLSNEAHKNPSGIQEILEVFEQSFSQFLHGIKKSLIDKANGYIYI